jgi:hypothetical protein
VGLIDEDRVADADAEQRAAGVVGFESGEPLAHLVDPVPPEVEDAGGDDDGRRRFDERLERAEQVAAGVGNPERAVSERLQLGRAYGPCSEPPLPCRSTLHSVRYGRDLSPSQRP